MLRKQTLLQLIELARHSSEHAARALGASQTRELDERGKLKLLMEYRDEYLRRYEQAARVGLERRDWSNYHAFLLKLDAAIRQQEQMLVERCGAVEQCRSAWRKANGKLKSFATLDARRQSAERGQERRREQRESDQAAARKPALES
jgi:flagellar FliJ protein